MPGPYPGEFEHPLVDITVSAISPGATHRTATTGQLADARGTSEITQIGSVRVLSSLALAGLYGDLTRLMFVPPVVQDGGGNIVYPDVFVVPVVDGVPLGFVLRWDASAPRNMLPNPAVTVGGWQVLLGIPFRKAMRERMNNLPLKATGLKATVNYRFDVFSERGFPNAGDTLITPLRIIGYGDLLTDDELAELAALGYDGTFVDQVPGFPEFRGTHRLKGGPLSGRTWSSLPGGTNQAETKIYRFFRQGINRVATGTSNRFFLTRDVTLGGSEDAVEDEEDLGFDFTRGAQADDYLRITHAGVIPGTNQAFWGVRVNDQVLPVGIGGSTEGLPVSQGFNPWAYGAVQPQRGDSNLYYAIPKTPLSLAVYRNKVAWFITPNGTAIPADEASIALAGVYVQVGEQ